VEVRRKVVKWGKQNPMSRHFHAKEDKETIATWRSDLDSILHVFNVRSVNSAWLLLTVRLQTELAISARTTAFDIRHDVANAYTVDSDARRDISNSNTIAPDVRYGVLNSHSIASGVRREVASSLTIVSDIRPNTVKNPEGVEYRNRAASIIRTPPITD